MIYLNRDRGLRDTMMRLAPLLLFLVGCSGCEDTPGPVNYGDTRAEVPEGATGFFWPTTGIIRQDFHGTESCSEPGYWYDEQGTVHHFPGGSNFHRGVDIENTRGTRVFAAHAGTVALVSFPPPDPGGLAVMVISSGGVAASMYCHLDSYAVSEGQQVTPNTVIGYMGDSGGQRYPHLHFNFLTTHWSGWAKVFTAGSNGLMVVSGTPMIAPPSR